MNYNKPIFSSPSMPTHFSNEYLKAKSQIVQEVDLAKSYALSGSPRPKNLIPTTPLTLTEYQNLIQESLTNYNLNFDEITINFLNSINDPAQLSPVIRFPAGSQIILALIPFTQSGKLLTEDELSRNEILKELIINPDGTVSGFSAFKTHLNQILPKEISTLTLTIPPYTENPHMQQYTKSDLINLKSSFHSQLNKLKQLLSLL